MKMSDINEDLIGKKCSLYNYNDLPKEFQNKKFLIIEFIKNFFEKNTIKIIDPITNKYIWTNFKNIKLKETEWKK